MRRPAQAVVTFYVAVVCIFLATPVIVVLVLSFSVNRYLEFPPVGWSSQWYISAFSSASWRTATWNSIVIALCATGLSAALGIPATLALVRGTRKLRRVLGIVLTLPIIVPVVSQAVAYYATFAPLHLIDTRTVVVISHAVICLPIFVLNVWAAVRRLDPAYEEAARTLGASPRQVLTRITLPLWRPGLVAGSVLAFMTSFDESVLALFLAGTRVITLPKRMWEGLQFALDPSVTAVGALLILINTTFMIVLFWYTDGTH